LLASVAFLVKTTPVGEGAPMKRATSARAASISAVACSAIW
jgi:hypothetical protein